jgi:hypothetical protein
LTETRKFDDTTKRSEYSYGVGASQEVLDMEQPRMWGFLSSGGFAAVVAVEKWVLATP